jgi:hypothetical protein
MFAKVFYVYKFLAPQRGARKKWLLLSRWAGVDDEPSRYAVVDVVRTTVLIVHDQLRRGGPHLYDASQPPPESAVEKSTSRQNVESLCDFVEVVPHSGVRYVDI